MTAPQVMTHPSDEIVAAFLDGRLDGEERQRVLDHTSECDECYSLSSAVWDYKADAKVVRPQFGRRVAVAAASLAVAAALLVVVFLPAFRDRRAMDAMVEASENENLPYRPAEGRLTGAFAYHEKPPVYRGDPKPHSLEEDKHTLAKRNMELAALEALESTRDPHLAGTALLILGHRDEAIAKLTEAANKKPNDTGILSDLASAYHARGREADLKQARELAEKAWGLEKTPQTAWNRALTRDTREAWDEYLAIDGTSEWAKEARERKSRLDPP